MILPRKTQPNRDKTEREPSEAEVGTGTPRVGSLPTVVFYKAGKPEETEHYPLVFLGYGTAPKKARRG